MDRWTTGIDMDFASHAQTRARFDNPLRAARYPGEWNPHKRRHRHEINHIEHALRYLAPDMRLLDLPCGTGRLTRLLLDRCKHVTVADVSLHMVNHAQLRLADHNGMTTLDFERHDVIHTSFADRAFDAVLCYRLMHHFQEPGLRRSALRELKRICSGPIIVSMFTSTALDYYLMLLKHLVRRNKPLHRSYISHAQFRADVAAAGLEVVEASPRLRHVSPVWLYVLRSRD